MALARKECGRRIKGFDEFNGLEIEAVEVARVADHVKAVIPKGWRNGNPKGNPISPSISDLRPPPLYYGLINPNMRIIGCIMSALCVYLCLVCRHLDQDLDCSKLVNDKLPSSQSVHVNSLPILYQLVALQ
jgi:hypothetical protein